MFGIVYGECPHLFATEPLKLLVIFNNYACNTQLILMR